MYIYTYTTYTSAPATQICFECIYICIRGYFCMYMCIGMYIYIHAFMYIYAYITFTYAHMHVHIHPCIFICRQMSIYLLIQFTV